MKTRTIVVALLLCLVAVTLCIAKTDAFIGTWKLNEAKSKIAPGTAKNSTVVYEVVGDQIRTRINGTDADGQPTHNEWTGKFDGKDYPVTGDPASDARALKQVNDHTLTLVVKKGGKVTITGKVVISADGKHRIVTTTSTDANGKKLTSTTYYDKE